MKRSVDPRRIAAVVVTFAVAVPALVVATGRAPKLDSQLVRGRAAIADASELHWDLGAAGRWVVVANEYGRPGLFIVDTTAVVATQEVPTAIGFPGRPTISPDGRFVTYQSVDANPGRSELHLFERDTGTTRTVVAAAADQPAAAVVDVAWSPDSRRLVYARTWQDRDGVWRGQLRELTIAGGEDRLLFEEPGRPARAPAFSPDGARIAFLQDADLMVMEAGGRAPHLLHGGGDAPPAPSAGLPDAPVWSPDGATLAYAHLADGCHRVHLLDPDGGALRWRSPTCAMRPQIAPDGAHLAYLQLGESRRTLRWRGLPASTADDEPLGFADGVTYEYGFVAADRLIALASTATVPRTLWQLAPGVAPVSLHGPLAAPLPPAVVSVVESTTIKSRDGLVLPVQIFPRTCGRGPGPAIVWLHGGPSEDIAPRWYQEPQYLASLGWTVIAVNYRGSTGNGEAFRALADDQPGQIEDVLAALAWTAARPDVDPARIVVLTVSWSTEIAYPAMTRSPVAVRGVIDWLGVPHPPRPGVAPPALWLSGASDRLTSARRAAAAARVAAGQAVTHVVLEGGHEFRSAAARRGALAAAEKFLDAQGGACTRIAAEAR